MHYTANGKPNTATMLHRLLYAIDWAGIPINILPFITADNLKAASICLALIYNALRIGEWIYKTVKHAKRNKATPDRPAL